MVNDLPVDDRIERLDKGIDRIVRKYCDISDVIPAMAPAPYFPVLLLPFLSSVHITMFYSFSFHRKDFPV